MKLVTIQASAIKAIFEVLKDILNDVNIYFRSDGMYIVTLDTARSSLVDRLMGPFSYPATSHQGPICHFVFSLRSLSVPEVYQAPFNRDQLGEMQLCRN